MRTRLSYFFAGFAVLTLALPIWARTDSTPFDLDQAETIGTTQLKPGHYELKAPEQAVEASVLKHGKVVAEVPCSWVAVKTKPSEDEVISNGNKIVRVEFGGRTEAISFN